MANQKLTNVKIKIIALALLMCLASQTANALGLGTLEVLSNLDQPFEGVVELTVAAGDDVDSVSAMIATAEDFASFNIDYPIYLQDMTLSLDRSGTEPTLKITSNEVVVKEPFIHFLIRVDWSGGSFLREYTALIDPPVYASETPRALSEPSVVGTDQSNQLDSTNTDGVSSSEVITQQQETITQSGGATDAQYGPVARGESLSLIAQDLQSQFPDLSIYQIMQVLFEENRSAFIDENINGLLAGVVLNISDLNVIRAVDVADSQAFFRDQMALWDPSSLTSGTDSTVLVGQDDYLDSDDDLFTADTSDSVSTEVAEQQDTFQVGTSTDTESFVSAAQGDSQQGEIISLQQEVTNLEASLSSSTLENQELRERISILEGQLADVNRLMSLDVEDSDLANLEATLAEQNNAEVDEVIDPLASEVLDEVDSLLVGDDDSVLAGFESDLTEVVDTPEEIIEEIEEVAEVEEAAPAVVTLSSQPSFIDNLLDSGLWKILAGVGGLILAGLALFVFRRRRADEEFEMSMMTIESHNSNSVDSKPATVTTASVANSVTLSAVEEETEEADGDKDENKDETSFLTVYSDSDAVVQADEVDPVAEADVYIAYGRDEQAEAVLLDGMASKPERMDIKHKLLSLYHKSNNSEAFERVSEELYAQKDQVGPEVWQEVCAMGKELLPNNPMFELSASELFVQSELSSSLADTSDADQGDSGSVAADEQKEDDSGDTIEFEGAFSVEDGESTLIEDTQLDAGSPTAEGSLTAEGSPTAEGSEPGEDLVALAQDEESIHLVNFEDGVSELDDVNIASLDISDDDGLLEIEDSDDGLEIDLNDVVEYEIDDKEEEDNDGLVHEVSDLEVDDDYDEARTQYELAKVFVDLGDEDGARKILTDIVGNDSISEDVLADAKKLLDSMDS